MSEEFDRVSVPAAVAPNRSANGAAPDGASRGRRGTAPVRRQRDGARERAHEATGPGEVEATTNGTTAANGVPADGTAAPADAATPAPAVNGALAGATALPETASLPAAGGTAGGTTTDVSSAGPGGEVDIWDRRIASGLAFLRRRLTGEYDVDEFGFDRELTDAVFHPLLRVLYRSWFRVETRGLANLPVNGPALVVANHSGTIAVDSLMLALAVHDEHPEHRYLRLLGADLVFRVPFLSELTRKGGGTLACNPDAERLMNGGELVGVFPEGFKGVGKLYRDRYKLQRFGRGGFVSAALRTGTPIIPAAIVGAEEIYPMLANLKPLARLLGTPYFPVTPTFPWLGPLGMVPLPSKWYIEFGEPMPTGGMADQADDPLVIFNLADQVRETIQQSLRDLLKLREEALNQAREEERSRLD